MDEKYISTNESKLTHAMPRRRSGISTSVIVLFFPVVLLSGCIDIGGLFGSAEIDISSLESFTRSYDQVVEEAAEEDPALSIQLSQSEQQFYKIMSVDLESMEFDGVPPELNFPNISRGEGMNILYQHLGDRLTEMDISLLPRTIQSEVDFFIEDYVYKVDQEILDIEQEMQSINVAKSEIDRITLNLIIENITQENNDIILQVVNGSNQAFGSAEFYINGIGNRRINFGEDGLKVGDRGEVFLSSMPDNAHLTQRNITVSAVTLSDGTYVTGKEVNQAISLLSARLDKFREFRDGLEDKLVEALR